MGAPDRTVRQLRLRARDAGDVRRTARQLEDALRCASLPDSGGRLLLVRRLDLGRLAADVTPQRLSLLIEQRVQMLGYTWIHGTMRDAAQANAVWFQDSAEALLTLARRVARGAAPREWFWPRVLPGHAPASDAAQTFERIITHVAAQPTGSVVLVQLIAQLACAVAPRALLGLLTPTAQRLLQKLAGQLGMLARDHRAPRHALLEHARARAVLRSPQGEVLTLSPELQVQAPWLPVLLVAARWSVADEPAPDVNAAERTALLLTSAAAAASEVSPGSQGVPATGEYSVSDAGHTSTHAATQTAPRLRAPHQQPLPARLGAEVAPAAVAASEAAALAEMGALHVSRAGGILFLLPLLARLGFAAWSEVLTTVQAQAIASSVLQQALRRLRVGEADPAHAMLADCSLQPVSCGNLELPAVWRDPRIDLQLPPAADSVQLATLWLTCCRRSLRRLMRIGLASLVLRSGALAWSLTHFDAYFALRDTDLRVRRHGLDIDPGWLPWFGRVVSFHYRAGQHP